MGEAERVPEPDFEEKLEEAPEEIDEEALEESRGPIEMTVRRGPVTKAEETIAPEEIERVEEAPAARIVPRPVRRGVNPSVAIAIASMSSVVLSVAAVAVWAPVELAFVMPWLLASLTTLGIGLGITATIRCRQG